MTVVLRDYANRRSLVKIAPPKNYVSEAITRNERTTLPSEDQ